MVAQSFPTYIKDPDDTLDYSWDWTYWLTGPDTIASCSVFSSPGIAINSFSYSTTAVTAWISGGSAGNPYSVTARIVTVGGRTADRTITISVQNQ